MVSAFQPRDFSVMVISEDVKLRKSIMSELRLLQYGAEDQGSIREAIAYLKKNDLPHIIFIDLDVSALTALEFVRMLRSDMSDEVEVIVMSSPEKISEAMSVLDAGAFDIFLKPLDLKCQFPVLMRRAIDHIILVQKVHDFADGSKGTASVALDMPIWNELAGSVEEFVRESQSGKLIDLAVSRWADMGRPKKVVFFQYHIPHRQVIAKAFGRLPEERKVRLGFPFKSSEADGILSELMGLSAKQEFIQQVCQTYQFKYPWMLPLVAGGQPLGLVVIEALPPLSSEEQIWMSHLSTCLAQALGLTLARESMNNLVGRDSTTGLIHYRIFKERLEHEMQRSYRLKHALSVISFSIDQFDHVIETHGQANADTVIRRVGETLKGLTRPQDIVGRATGHEFVVALTHTKFEAALSKAGSLRTQIEKLEFEFGTTSVSGGIASYPSHANTADELLKRAWEARNRAQADGGNRIVPAQPAQLHVPSFAPVA